MIDETSLKILKILQEKARIPNVEVARQVGMAPSAVLERIRKLEKLGYIDGYEVRLNPAKFGRNLVAFVQVDVKSSSRKHPVGKKLAAIPEVLEVHFVTGEDCYLVKLRVADAPGLGKLIQENMEPYVLEIYHEEKDIAKNIKDFRSEKTENRHLLYSNNISKLEQLTKKYETGDYFLRQANLEDLFLKITGRELNE